MRKYVALAAIVCHGMLSAQPGWSQEDDSSPADVDTPTVQEIDAPSADVINEASAVRGRAQTDERRFQFSFRNQPWEDVIDWFAELDDLSVALEVTPSGRFNYVDDKRYTSGEALDIVNSVLLTKGYTMLRRNKMLFIVDLEDNLDAQLVRDLLMEVPVDQLDQRGAYEVTKCRFALNAVPPEEAATQINQLLSPVGSVVVMPKAKQILVTETGGTLRAIRDVLHALEQTAIEEQKAHIFRLRSASPEEVLAIARPLLDIPEDANAAEDGSIRLSADPLGGTIFATGKAEKVTKVKQIVEHLERSVEFTSARGAAGSMEFRSHNVAAADADAVLRVLQTIFLGDSGVRVEVHPTTGDLIALARPDQHLRIEATIAEMERHPESFEVIPLRILDPASAVLLIEKIFSSEDGNAPVVDGMLQPRQLIVRGTQAQIRQVRALLTEMGENLDGRRGSSSQGGNIRYLPIDPATAESLLRRAQTIWPRVRSNQIRIITPSQPAQSATPAISTRRRQPIEGSQGAAGGPESRESTNSADVPNADAEQQQQSRPRVKRVEVTQATLSDELSESVRFVNGVVGTRLAQASKETQKLNQGGDQSKEPEVADDTAASADSQKGEIVVAPGPSGVVIASEDTEALDDFESIVNALSGQGVGGPRFNIFYLKHIGAEAARDLVSSILSTTAVSSASSASRSSDSGTGGLIGTMLSGGATGTGLGGPPSIVADNRLNALIVQGAASQINLTEQLLRVIDQEAGPEEVLTFPKPKFIPVYFTSAESVAEVVRQVYADRIDTGNNSNSGRGGRGGGFPGFGGFGRGGFGGRGGGGDNGRNAQSEGPKMTLGVDTGSNSLVVSAPGPLLKEVESVVTEIDRRANTTSGDDISVVTLKRANAQYVQQSLANLLGDMVQTRGSTSSTSRSGSNNGQAGDGNRPGGPPAGPNPDAIRQRLEFFNAIRGGGGFGRGGGPGGSGFGRGGDGGRGFGNRAPTGGGRGDNAGGRRGR